VLGWTDDMPSWMTAADIVIGNAGDATGLEAMACGRPVVMFDPIARHGRANAELMASAWPTRQAGDGRTTWPSSPRRPEGEHAIIPGQSRTRRVLARAEP